MLLTNINYLNRIGYTLVAMGISLLMGCSKNTNNKIRPDGQSGSPQVTNNENTGELSTDLDEGSGDATANSQNDTSNIDSTVPVEAPASPAPNQTSTPTATPAIVASFVFNQTVNDSTFFTVKQDSVLDPTSAAALGGVFGVSWQKLPNIATIDIEVKWFKNYMEAVTDESQSPVNTGAPEYIPYYKFSVDTNGEGGTNLYIDRTDPLNSGKYRVEVTDKVTGYTLTKSFTLGVEKKTLAERMTMQNCRNVTVYSCGHLCGNGTRFNVTCKKGEYMAGYGVSTYSQYSSYNPHIRCCQFEE